MIIHNLVGAIVLLRRGVYKSVRHMHERSCQAHLQDLQVRLDMSVLL
jgi:hypothetical protein